MKTLIVAIGFTLLIFFLYKYVLNPQIIISQATQECPSRWTYNNPLCTPDYETTCKAFDPSKMGKADRIDFIQKCGLQWP